MIRYVALAVTLLLAACSGGFSPGPGRVPGNINTERPEVMPSNSYQYTPNSMPR